ncbi:MAG: amidase family protein, partial [Dehalococcoidales bacterium]
MESKENRNPVNPADLCYTPAMKLREMIQARQISPVEVVTAFLERIDKINPAINAYCTLVPEMALEAARKAESAVMKGGDTGLLTGIPVSIKDVT